MHINWADLGYGSAAFTVFVLPMFKRVRNFFRNFFQDWTLMRGSKAIEGMRSAVAPLGRRLADDERDIRKNTEDIASIRTTMVTKDDHAELVKRINSVDQGQIEILRRIGVNDKANEEILKKMTRNGEDSPELGDTTARLEKLVGAIAEKVGAEIEPDVKQNLRRREDDRKSS